MYMYNTRRMQCIVGERERPNLSCWVCKKHIQKPSAHVKETSPTFRQFHNAIMPHSLKGQRVHMPAHAHTDDVHDT